MGHFKIEDLNFSYPSAKGRRSLVNISLTIARGQYVTICGKSGSGKTTLLKHLKSVLTPHGQRTGRVLFDGRELESIDLREQSSRIGYVMQNPDNQIVTDKVWHELAFGLESLGMDQKTIRLRVAEMASYFGIQGWFHKNVAELSGGQKQLLNLASIMAMQPDVLILDEPTSQLDPIAASDFLNTVKKINLELRTTIIITEHRLEDIFHASDKVVVMEKGRIIAEDEPRKVGEFLRQESSQMFAAMPTPVQVYYGVLAGAGAKDNMEVPDTSGYGSDLTCPLTVREGGDWLSEMFADMPLKVTRVEDGVGAVRVGVGAVRVGAGGVRVGADPAGADAAAASDRTISTADRSCTDRPAIDLLDPKPADCALMVREAWFRYEKDAPDVLKGVSFRVPKGSLYAIVGGNGTGKSTTLKAICDICRPYRGRILIDGKPVNKYKTADLFRGNLAMLPQDPQSLFVQKTVREDLTEMLTGKEKKESRAADGTTTFDRVEEIARLCEVEDLLTSHPYDLSGGEQQRAALAKVLLTKPRLLLLDEPTKGIDNFFKIKLAEILRKLITQGVTIVMVSHDVEFCAKYADVVSMFFDGSIITTNTPNRFFSQNSFYTTAANRMSRHIFENAINNEDVIRLCRENLAGKEEIK